MSVMTGLSRKAEPQCERGCSPGQEEHAAKVVAAPEEAGALRETVVGPEARLAQRGAAEEGPVHERITGLQARRACLVI